MTHAKVCADVNRFAFSSTETVHIVGAGASGPHSLTALIELAGWRVECHASSEALFARLREAGAGCVLINASTQGDEDETCLEMVGQVASEMPAIILGRADVAAAVRAIKAGAVEFLPKPISAWSLLDAIDRAIGISRSLLEEHMTARRVRADYASLSQRERQVLALISRGLLNKQVGGELGISEITVKAHRGQVMRKMKAPSFADLVHMAVALGLTRPTNPLQTRRQTIDRYDGVAETFA